MGGLKATVSSRQIKALIEQITGMSLFSHYYFLPSFPPDLSSTIRVDLSSFLQPDHRGPATRLTTRPIFPPPPDHAQTPFPHNNPTTPLINLSRPNHILPRRIRDPLISIRTVRTRCPNPHEGWDPCRSTFLDWWSRGFG